MYQPSRRHVLQCAAGLSVAGLTSWLPEPRAVAGERPERKMAFGLVTYLWGHDWDLPTLIANCEASGVLGVELRTTHAHGVEPHLDKRQRQEVSRRFADSRVTLVGLGSNERFDNPDPARLQQAIQTTKDFLKLSHDVGSSGVKVKPDRFHPGVPREQTIEQIGRALNEVGQFAARYGQQVRLEVHGQCAELPTIRAILDVADHESVAVCWNSNPQDLQGEGLEHNFRLVRPRFGATCHVHELDSGEYPYGQLFDLMLRTEYDGWVLMEASSKPADRVAALIQQRQLFEQLTT